MKGQHRLGLMLGWAELRQHPGRTLMIVLAIALGVMLGYAIRSINTAALSEFTAALRTVNGQADLQLRPRGVDLPQSVHEWALRQPQIAAVSPVLELDVPMRAQHATQGHSGSKPQMIKVYGLDVFEAARITPDLLGMPAQADATQTASPASDDDAPPPSLDPNALFLSTAAQQALGVQAGDYVRLQAGTQEVVLLVRGGLLRNRDGHKLAVIDLGAAQHHFGRQGRLSRLDLKLTPGQDAERQAEHLSNLLTHDPALGASYVAQPSDAELRMSNLSRAYRVNLGVLAFVALLTGGFLVYATMALAVAKRRPQLAMMRLIGVDATTTVRWVLAECLLLGLVGAALGIALGHGLAVLALQHLGGDLGGGYFVGGKPQAVLEPLSVALFAALGAAVAVLGGAVPALSAARLHPMDALRGDLAVASPLAARTPATLAGAEARRAVPWRTLWGSPWLTLALLMLALLLASLPPLAELPVLGFAAIAVVLAAGVQATPWLGSAVFKALSAAMWRAALPDDRGSNSAAGVAAGGGRGAPSQRARLARTSAWLAMQRLANAPSQATMAASGVMVSVAVAAAMSTMVSSFRTSVDQWLEQVLPAPLYLRASHSSSSGAASASFDAAARLAVQNTDMVERVRWLRISQLSLQAHRPAVTLIARDVSPHTAQDDLPLVGESLSPAAAKPGEPAPTPIWVSEAMVDLYQMRPGQRLQLPIPAGQGSAFKPPTNPVSNPSPDQTSHHAANPSSLPTSHPTAGHAPSDPSQPQALTMPVFVAGVWRDYARQHGSIIIPLAAWQAHTGDTLANEASLWLKPGVRPDTVMPAIRASLSACCGTGDLPEFAEAATIRAVSLMIFDRSFTVTYLLEAVALAIGLAGVSATFAGQALARRREFGTLRHLGFAKRTVLRSVVVEGAGVTALGLLLGLLAGWLIAALLVHVVNPQSFHWTMSMTLPWGSLLALAAAMLTAGTLTTALAARASLGDDVVIAVREDW